MTIALLAVLTFAVAVNAWVADRKDKRHDAHLTRLLVHVQAPDRAVAYATSKNADGPLYVPSEDDEAWREAHKAAD